MIKLSIWVSGLISPQSTILISFTGLWLLSLATLSLLKLSFRKSNPSTIFPKATNLIELIVVVVVVVVVVILKLGG